MKIKTKTRINQNNIKNENENVKSVDQKALKRNTSINKNKTTKKKNKPVDTNCEKKMEIA